MTKERVTPDQSAVARILRAATDWVAAARRGRVAPMPAAQRALLRRTARILEGGFEAAVRRAGLRPARPGRPSELAPDERKLLALMAAGMTYKEMAAVLGVDYGTVHARIKALYRRFGVHSKLGLVRRVGAT